MCLHMLQYLVKRCILFQFILTPKLPLLSYSKHLYLVKSLILKQQFLDKSTACNAQGRVQPSVSRLQHSAGPRAETAR